MNGKTTFLGVLTIVAGVSAYIVALLNGHGQDPTALAALAGAITTGIGLIHAADAKPQP